MGRDDDARKALDATPGEPRAGAGVLGELAGTSVGVKSLLATFPAYARRWLEIARSPIAYFRRPLPATDAEFSQSIAFLLQAMIVSFIVLTMGRALPQSIATFAAVQVPLVSGSAADLQRYAQRVDAITRALPSNLANSWLRQGELMLAVRVLPEDRFALLLERVAQLAKDQPDRLARAIDGSLAGPERFGGRGYLLSFFTALHPQRGALLYQTYQISYAGPVYQLPPYIDFIAGTVLLWYLVCALAALLAGARGLHAARRNVFAAGALVWGFLGPLYEVFKTLLRFYLAFTLPAYIPPASALLAAPPPPGLVSISGGVFPYENLALVVVQAAATLAVIGVALATFTEGLRRALPVPAARAAFAATVGLAVGLGLTELAMRILVLILAPTGLL
jgi:hypothetical protein